MQGKTYNGKQKVVIIHGSGMRWTAHSVRI